MPAATSTLGVWGWKDGVYAAVTSSTAPKALAVWGWKDGLWLGMVEIVGTNRELESTMSGAGTATCSLTIERPLGATMLATGIADVAMIVERPLAASAMGGTTISIALSRECSISATMQGYGDGAAEMVVERALSVTGSGEGTVTVTLLVRIPAVLPAMDLAGEAVTESSQLTYLGTASWLEYLQTRSELTLEE